MSKRRLTPFAADGVLDSEQGGTGLDGTLLTQGQLFVSIGNGIIVPTSLVAGANVTIDTSIPGEIIIASTGGGGGGSNALTSKTANYQVLVGDATPTGTLLGDATAGSFTFTLPAAAAAATLIYNFKKTDASANTVTIAQHAGGETIDGQASYIIGAQYASVTVQSDGTKWNIL